ncbi:MAG: aminodeoxychorismate synthase component I [Gammaproteobacteria bacterium]|nr:aminodeoxychorismate synthase component I [Gammaproteobacteria bacterium]
MNTQLLPYKINSAELFSRFAHLPYSVFVDSCRSAQTEGRYDIIVAAPSEIITETTCHTHTIFDEIKSALANLKSKSDADNRHNLPFTIGAIGYLSYDIARNLENMPEIAIDDIALPKAIVGIYDWSIVVDHLKKKTYFTSLHDLDHPAIKNIFALCDGESESFCIRKNFQSNMTREYYNDAFNVIKKNIIAGNCYQVNLAQRFSAEFTGSTWEAYKLLREKNPAPYAAFMQLENASILSLSPERFLKVSDGVVETKPIKGTSPRFTDPIKDKQSGDALLNSGKDRAENVMIVDLLRNDLSRACIAGSVQVPTLCALESFSNVHHLVSTITGKLSPDKTAMDLLQACFPGGSITGAPKIAAMKIIESLEPHRRSVYCGSLFYMDINGNLDSNIAIRTVICDKNKMHLYAGGGIVYDSECNKEYEETLLKVKKIMDILNAH